MKTTAPIPRDPLKVPKPLSNPASAVIRDTIEHQRVTQADAAVAMNISKAQLSDIIRQRKGVPADLLIRLQAQFDFQKAYHAKGDAIRKEVRTLA